MFQIDTSDLWRAEWELTRKFESAADWMLKAAQDAADMERRTHSYVNRTYRLENSTEAVMVCRTPDCIRVDLAMTAPYASVIEAKGLSNIMFASIEAQTAMERFLHQHLEVR